MEQPLSRRISVRSRVALYGVIPFIGIGTLAVFYFSDTALLQSIVSPARGKEFGLLLLHRLRSRGFIFGNGRMNWHIHAMLRSLLALLKKVDMTVVSGGTEELAKNPAVIDDATTYAGAWTHMLTRGQEERNTTSETPLITDCSCGASQTPVAPNTAPTTAQRRWGLIEQPATSVFRRGWTEQLGTNVGEGGASRL